MFDKPPEAAVIAVIPVISHDEYITGRNGDRAIIIAWTNSGAELRLGSEMRMQIDDFSIIYHEMLVDDFDLVAGDGDHSF